MKTALTVAALICPLLLEAQVGKLSVTTEPAGAEVYLDSVLIGRAPVSDFEVPEGLHRLRLFAPSARNWNAVTRQETVYVTGGREIRKTVEMGSSFAVHSVPHGADVLVDGEVVGTTPLFYRTPGSVKGEIIVRLQGFEPKAIDASMPAGIVMLTPTDGMNERREMDFEPESDVALRRWLTYSSATTMILSGVLAAYYKERANNRFDSYLSTNDPALLASTERNDRRSAAALIITQISFGILGYLLLSE